MCFPYFFSLTLLFLPPLSLYPSSHSTLHPPVSWTSPLPRSSPFLNLLSRWLRWKENKILSQLSQIKANCRSQWETGARHLIVNLIKRARKYPGEGRAADSSSLSLSSVRAFRQLPTYPICKLAPGLLPPPPPIHPSSELLWSLYLRLSVPRRETKTDRMQLWQTEHLLSIQPERLNNEEERWCAVTGGL